MRRKLGLFCEAMGVISIRIGVGDAFESETLMLWRLGGASVLRLLSGTTVIRMLGRFWSFCWTRMGPLFSWIRKLPLLLWSLGSRCFFGDEHREEGIPTLMVPASSRRVMLPSDSSEESRATCRESQSLFLSNSWIELRVTIVSLAISYRLCLYSFISYWNFISSETGLSTDKFSEY